MRAFTLGDQFRPSTSQLFSKPLFLQRENIIKLDIVSLRFSHYDLGRVEQKFRCFFRGTHLMRRDRKLTDAKAIISEEY